MALTLRPAREEDQPTIVALIRQARLNPRNLHWEHFLVAEENGRVVGVRQVKVHAGGTREVASGFVLPEYRHQGISARLMNEIFARQKGPLYTVINEKWTPYYEQFGFRRVDVNQLPSDFSKEYKVARIITSLISMFIKEKLRIIPMKKE